MFNESDVYKIQVRKIFTVGVINFLYGVGRVYADGHRSSKRERWLELLIARR